MPISSMIVRIAEDRARPVAERINAVVGAQVAYQHNDSFVVLTDTPSEEADQALWDAIKGIPGVLHVDLIYHNFEDAVD